MKILDPHAQPVKAQPPQRLQVLARGHSRVDLDPHLRVRRKVKMLARGAKQIFNLLRSQIRRRPAAPVKLQHWPFFRNAAAHPLHFALQHVEIRRRHALVFLDDYVASAKQAQALAKRNVHVQRNGAARPFRLRVHLLQIIRAKRIVPHRRGRIARIPRPRPVVARQKFFAHAKLFRHMRQGWIRDTHCQLLNATAPQRAFPLTKFACCPVSTKSLAFSTGVCCKMPCPRFKMCPTPPSDPAVSCVTLRIVASGANNTAGSTFPCSAIRGPSAFRSSRKSTRQSTLKTSAPESAAASSK